MMIGNFLGKSLDILGKLLHLARSKCWCYYFSSGLFVHLMIDTRNVLIALAQTLNGFIEGILGIKKSPQEPRVGAILLSANIVTIYLLEILIDGGESIRELVANQTVIAGLLN